MTFGYNPFTRRHLWPPEINIAEMVSHKSGQIWLAIVMPAALAESSFHVTTLRGTPMERSGERTERIYIDDKLVLSDAHREGSAAYNSACSTQMIIIS